MLYRSAFSETQFSRHCRQTKTSEMTYSFHIPVSKYGRHYGLTRPPPSQELYLGEQPKRAFYIHIVSMTLNSLHMDTIKKEHDKLEFNIYIHGVTLNVLSASPPIPVLLKSYIAYIYV